MSRHDLAAIANAIADDSTRGGAPVLSAESSREDLCEWLQWCDPNGSHTDRAVAAEQDMDPYDLDGAWEALAAMTEDA